MDLKRLKYFCTIVEQGSISRAAKLLFMAQPPLSKRLQELEEEVGTPLLLRTGKRLVPTEAGHFLYQRGCEILRTVEETRRKAIEIASSERRVLRVGVSYLFLRHFMPVIRQLYTRNPRAEISVSVSDSSHLEDLLQRHQIDVALMQRPQHTEGYSLFDFPPVGMKALVSPSLADLPQQGSLRLEDLGNVPLILLKRVEGSGTFEIISDYLRKCGMTPNVKMHVSDPTIAIDMIESGIAAVVLLPASEVTHLMSGTFRILDIFPCPSLFMPVAMRLSTSVDLPELLEIISTLDA